MYLRMAILAGLALAAFEMVETIGDSHEVMALHAKPWTRQLQRILVYGAVRLVAVVAVLTHRRMFEQEWPALLGVTGVANVVD